MVRRSLKCCSFAVFWLTAALAGCADTDGETTNEQQAAPSPDDTDPEAARRRVMAEAKRTWPDASTEEREGLRHALGVVATYTPRQAEGKPPVASVNEMTIAERLKLSTLLADVRAERMSIARVADTDEGLPRYECALASRSKVATIVRRAVDDWDVSVSNTVQEEPAGE